MARDRVHSRPLTAAGGAEGGPFPERSVRALGAALVEALTAIHGAALIHRDLKPANVLLAQDGPRVIDFGISRLAEHSGLTLTGTTIGSPGYMSPEQIQGLPIEPSSDVFSLGSVLAFAATGAGPFGEASVPALLFRVVHEDPDLQAVPDELRELISSCLAKTPADRPALPDLMPALTGGRSPVEMLGAGWLPESLQGDEATGTLAFPDVPTSTVELRAPVPEQPLNPPEPTELRAADQPSPTAVRRGRRPGGRRAGRRHMGDDAGRQADRRRDRCAGDSPPPARSCPTRGWPGIWSTRRATTARSTR